MQTRPRVSLNLSASDRFLEYLGWMMILALWFYTLYMYSELPEIIPTHFNAAGKADGFGKKSSILLLPFIATILYVGLTLLNRYPHVFNYAENVTQENALRLYTTATRTIRYLKVIIVIVFALIVYFTVGYSEGNTRNPGMWLLPVILLLTAIPLIYYAIRSYLRN